MYFSMQDLTGTNNVIIVLTFSHNLTLQTTDVSAWAKDTDRVSED